MRYVETRILRVLKESTRACVNGAGTRGEARKWYVCSLRGGSFVSRNGSLDKARLTGGRAGGARDASAGRASEA